MKTGKSEKREKARKKARYGPKVGSKSVFVMEQAIYDRALRIIRKSSEKEER